MHGAKRVFLDDRPLTSLMVPRSDVQWLEAAHSVAKCLEQLGAHGGQGTHSWYPVCRHSLDDVVGVISVARLLELGVHEAEPIERHATPATFPPETLSGMELLEQSPARRAAWCSWWTNTVQVLSHE